MFTSQNFEDVPSVHSKRGILCCCFFLKFFVYTFSFISTKNYIAKDTCPTHTHKHATPRMRRGVLANDSVIAERTFQTTGPTHWSYTHQSTIVSRRTCVRVKIATVRLPLLLCEQSCCNREVDAMRTTHTKPQNDSLGKLLNVLFEPCDRVANLEFDAHTRANVNEHFAAIVATAEMRLHRRERDRE